ncbi:TrmH family RNA methyltransferase [Oceanihabitans sediminis]|uniref:TrmH family RNA methyltransferase n=1 Tax=Oceanihabitans sediminis TaxID=1812012 RepID=A0A368P8M3_9FLAO|nr:TrmH family RNA methyltransferase [Oceanihabitans sediminis]MDX1277541.1 TrmH family RNA methyltransferase [Oceanihabitans sediminis]MDX1773438.1 TrmH family RNA methyltransferase [Oceanihabitans sediminis]RBP32893.1 SpoU rRNA methylase family protein [Oceanihabitans sediminis]RCU57581.1 TrmH family RNA methyltransferase [Oceanihabitans sediminis]
MQLNHYNTNFEKRTFPISIICENVSNAPNIGSLFRTSDTFGVKKIVFCGEHIPLGRKMTKTSRATEKVVNFEVKKEAIEVALQYKKEGYHLIALEITNNSSAISSTSFSNEKPYALIIGDENFGVSEEILKICDSVVHIEMYGQNSSMNVVQATTVALYEITKQLR